MKPFQFKMSTGTTYVGFPGPVDDFGMFPLSGGCMMIYVTAESRFDIRGLMYSFTPTEINISNVQARQELADVTDHAMAYCRYLGNLIPAMEEEKIEVPKEFTDYIQEMDPYYKTQFDGVGILLSGQYDFAVTNEDPNAEKLRKKLERVAKEYREAKSKPVEKSCSENVVHLQFGSNRNATEEKSND